MDSYLPIPSGTKYLGDALTELPKNCIFNKFLVGCGGTTVALKCKSNYVICVPFVSLIQNKLKQTPGIFGLYKGVSVKDLKSYLIDETIEFKKVMVTYDSLYKLKNYLNPLEYHLLVDEYHLLFTSYSWRHLAVTGVLENYLSYKSHCFMTATLLEREFLLDELKEIPIVTAKWESVKEITVRSIKCEHDVIHTAVYLVNEYLDGTKQGNAYLFVNSVEFIKSIVEHCKLTDENARAIWSMNNKTQTGLKRGLTTDDPKKINLMTSTCFEGCDFYDEEAHIYIISDSSKSHTLIDISTSLQQIAHRIRDTKYWEVITHIYNTTRYGGDVTYEEYKKVTELETKKAKGIINDYPSLSNDIQNVLKDHYKKETNYDTYLRVNNDNLYFDENMIKIDLYNFKVTKSMYKLRVNLNSEYKKNNLIYEQWDSQLEHVVEVNPKPSFKETVIECMKGDSDFIQQAYKKYEFLHEAVVKFGYKGIEDMKYRVTDIKRKLIQMSSINEKRKIQEYLKVNSYIKEGTFITLKTAKDVVTQVYKEANITTSPKATELEQFYYLKECMKKVNDKMTKGYNIIKAKL